jgi:hypothetical protein
MTTRNEDSRDNTIADIHKTRQRISDRFGGDIQAISDDARRRQNQSGRPTISRANCSEKPSVSRDE